MKAKSTRKKKKNTPAAGSVDDCYLRVKAMLDFRLTVTAMRNISVSPGRDGVKPVVELCGTVNFEPTKKFAEDSASLVSCIKDGSHKLVNSIKVVPTDAAWPPPGLEDVTCCCPESGCAVMTTCPGC